MGASPAKSITGLDRLIRSTEEAANIVVAVSLILMMLLITAEVIVRSLFDTPIQGLIQLVSMFLMPAVVFLGLGRTQREGGHVAVSVLSRLYGQKMRLVMGTVIHVLGIAYFTTLALASYNIAMDQIGVWTVGTPSLPMGLSRLIVVAGILLMLARLVLQLSQLFASPTKNAHPD